MTGTLLVVAITCCPGVGLSQGETGSVKSDLARVKQLEISRQNERSAWKRFTAHPSATVRQAAMVALGRVQAPRTAPLLSQGIKDTDAQVRRSAAYAIGQMESGALHALRKALKTETDPKVRLTVIEALGKRGSQPDIKPLTMILRGTDSPSRSRAFLSLGLIARRASGRLPGFDGGLATGAITDPSAHVRFGAAYLMYRARKVNFRNLESALSECLNDEMPWVRSICVRMMGRLGTEGRALRDEAARDTNWQVQVALARADRAAGDHEAIGERMDQWAARLEAGAVDEESPLFHAMLALVDAALAQPSNAQIIEGANALYRASTFRSSKPQSAKEELIPDTPDAGTDGGLSDAGARDAGAKDAGAKDAGAKDADKGRSIAEPKDIRLAHINCGVATIIDRQKRSRKLTRICGGSDYPQRLREKWMARVADELPEQQRIKVLEKYFQEFGTDGQLVVIDALSSLVNRRKADALLLRALKSSTGAVVGTAANVAVTIRPKAVEELLIQTYRRVYAQREFEAVQSIFDALGRLESVAAKGVLDRHTDDNHPGVRQAALNAIKVIEAAEERKLREADSAQGHLPQRSAFAPPPAEALSGESADLGLIEPPEFVAATILTNRGPIEINLLTRDAPQTTKHFARLVKRGFYDGLLFHRVVPDFVVQGGDPDGDGWGGPGYTIPCEVNETPFKTGVVGMALSGKDTGGSQFFITHSPQPHLDGKYTAFARVREGQNVVASLGEGDRIISVKLHRRN